MSFETGFDAIAALIRRESERSADSRNEAQTRFDLIDDILHNVLDWPRTSTKVERHDESGYTDYELVHGTNLAIVEAKREGQAFALPTARPSGTYPIPALADTSSNRLLKSALEQAVRYAGSRGVAACVVTNGNQWVAFIGGRNDGMPPLEGRALTFTSLQDIRTDFLSFYENLSLEGMQRRKLLSSLGTKSSAPPPALSASIANYPGTKRRNVVQQTLQYMGEILFEELPHDAQYKEEFLNECYSMSGALSGYAEVSKKLLTGRNSAAISDRGAIEHSATDKRGVNPLLASESLSAAESHRPIVLLGNVGAGKSTFLQHLVHVDAKSIFKNAIAVRIDYGAGATFSSPTDFALARIESELVDKYGIDIQSRTFLEDVYKKELERFDEGVFGGYKSSNPERYESERVAHLVKLLDNKGAHLGKSLERVSKTRRRQVVIFLDNVDQRSREDQNAVFLASNELASSTPATVYVTLRPETYFESHRYGAVSGYHPRVFSISPPRVDTLLQKRVQFAQKILRSGSDPRVNFTLESDNLSAFLRVLDVNFRKNRRLLTLIENIAGGNMRQALDFVTQFIGSGHVDTEKIIAAELRDPGRYMIPIHEFLRALLHGNGEHFDPTTSPLPNLFGLSERDSSAHFLLPLALDYLHTQGEASSGAGFIDLDELTRYLQSLGYSHDAIEYGISIMARTRIAESPLQDLDVTNANELRITTTGAYVLNNLPQMFTYCDAVIVDTSIVDDEYRAEIREVSDLQSRLDRVSKFRAYLDKSWVEAGIDAQGWNWPQCSRELAMDISEVARKANLRNPSPEA